MIIILRADATPQQVQHILETVVEWGVQPHVSRGVERTIIGLIGPEDILRTKPLEAFPGVERVMPVLKPYKRASLDFRREPSVIRIGAGPHPVELGGQRIVMMAGPCSVESRDGFLAAADAVRDAGATMLRGGAFKPRSSPYSFQGMGEEGLLILAEARERTGLPVVTEVMDTKEVDLVGRYADMLQIGARNMQNYALLREVGRTHLPVLLKRGMSATVKEWLMAAEYVLNEGNESVALCERGIRTFETYTRNTLDLSAVAALRRETHLPVVVDPSHGTGIAEMVPSMARAAVAAGADGIMVEVHPCPEKALSDGEQSIVPAAFQALVEECRALAGAIGRGL